MIRSQVLGLGAYLVWKYPIGIVLALYVLTIYVYMGRHSFWDFVDRSGRNLLAPLRGLPLRLGKVDFAPLIALACVLVAAQFIRQGLTLLYSRLPF